MADLTSISLRHCEHRHPCKLVDGATLELHVLIYNIMIALLLKRDPLWEGRKCAIFSHHSGYDIQIQASTVDIGYTADLILKKLVY